MSRYRGLVVADDLTGAADTGHEFAARGYHTVVRMGDGPLPTPSVLVENTDSRDCSPEEANARIEDALRNATADVVYKKVDSTLRGNVASEVAAVLSATGAALGVVAPAFPENGRTTTDGHHLVDGEPVDTVVEGVTSAHLPTLLANSHSVVEVGLATVDEGPNAVEAALADALEAHTNPPLVVCDATEPAHLDTLATGAAALKKPVVYVGSAGLARHVKLPDHDPIERSIGRDGPRTHKDGRVLGVVGSTNPRTLAQLAALATDHVITLDGTAVLDDPETAADEAANDCDERFRNADRVVVTAAKSEEEVAETIRYGRDHRLSDAAIRGRIARALAGTARAVYACHALDGLVLTGGAVATAVLSALDADGLRLLGESVGSGVPIAEIVGGSADGALVVTKAGGFGERTILRTALATLRNHEY